MRSQAIPAAYLAETQRQKKQKKLKQKTKKQQTTQRIFNPHYHKND